MNISDLLNPIVEPSSSKRKREDTLDDLSSSYIRLSEKITNAFQETMPYFVQVPSFATLSIQISQMFHNADGRLKTEDWSLFKCHDFVLGCPRKHGCNLQRKTATGGYKRVFLNGFLLTRKTQEGDITLEKVAISKPLKRTDDCLENFLKELQIETRLPENSYLLRAQISLPYFKESSERLLLAAPLATGDLEGYRLSLNYSKKLKAIYHILQGVAALHQHELRHGDLSLRNCLAFDSGNRFTVADFGFLSSFHDPSFRLGTCYFLAPEAVRFQYRSPNSIVDFKDTGQLDAWALGVVFCVLIFKDMYSTFLKDLRVMIKEQSSLKIKQASSQLQSSIHNYLSASVQAQPKRKKIASIIRGLLTVEPLDRLSVIDAVKLLKEDASGKIKVRSFPLVSFE